MIPARGQSLPRSVPTKIVAIYAAISAFWIFFSDSLLDLLVHDRQQLARLAMLKGWLFVLVTSILLFYLIRRYVVCLRDINSDLERQMQERRAAEEALRESESRFRNLMEQVHMGALMLDREGRLTFCNDHLLGLTGWSREEIIGRNWFELFIPPDICQEVRAMFTRGIESGDIPSHFENEILTRSGDRRLLVWDNTLLRDSSGRTIGSASLGIDVTEHRRLEAQLLQSQKMETVGTLAGGIAHDFNNILTVIMSCATLLRNKLEDRERAVRLIEQIDHAAERAASLTGSLLAFSRKQSIAPRRIDLNQVVSSMQEFLERIIGEDVQLTTRPADMQLPVHADGAQLEQVIMNLVSNARDAMPGGGSIVIETARTVLDERELSDGSRVSGPFAVLRVTDSGTGIAPPDRGKVFEPFFTTKEVGKGTGLGLSMVYGIIRQHNGWIDLESALGQGSSFSVYLPLEGEPEAPAIRQEQPLPRGTGTILLVEDDPQVLQVNREILETGGYRVLEAVDGTQAIKTYRRMHREIALAIVDVIMPGMTGRQLYDELKLVNPELEVIFTSGYTADILDRQDLPAGCAFSPKPHKAAELLALVHDMLERKRMG